MSRNATMYASLDVRPKTHQSRVQQGEVRTYTLDLSQVADRLGTTISTSIWETPYSSSLTLASAALSSNVATVVASAVNIGRVFLKNTAVAANGSTFIQWFDVKIQNYSSITP